MALDAERAMPATPRSDLGPHREEEYWALPDEPRCELLYGRFVVTPSPELRHQGVVALLHERLLDFRKRAGGWLYFAPLDVRLAAHSVVQPDLLWISRERRAILGERVFGAPDLAIEVLSPTSGRRDRGEKLRLYAESGVAEYWLVDPAGETCEFLVLRDGRYEIRLAADGRYRSPVHDGLELDVESFWRDLAERELG